jgi:hypothetical protein
LKILSVLFLKEFLSHAAVGTKPFIRQCVKFCTRGYPSLSVPFGRVILIPTYAALPFFHNRSPFSALEKKFCGLIAENFFVKALMPLKGALKKVPLKGVLKKSPVTGFAI